MEKQKTIKTEISLEGLGLHTGNKAKITFKPAAIDNGITFMRIDLPDKPVIKATPDFLLSLARGYRRTSIGTESVEIHTVEHLMAVLSGLAIDNLNIEINNNEIPGLDGSGLLFLEAIEKAGVVEQEKERNSFFVKDSIVLEENGASIVVLPSNEYKVTYTLSYNHPLLRAQFLDLAINPEAFRKELAASRTFCLDGEAEELLKQGLGKGANYENTLVVGKEGVIKNKLRFEDEFVRHKMLDLLGDLSILGFPIKGHIIAVKSGHSLNLKLLKKIQQQKERALLGGIKLDYKPEYGEQLDIETIMKILPHRYPFLFVDRILELEKGKRAVGIKNVTINDNFFPGHFPRRPIMPGVLIIEAMAQVGGIMMLSPLENRGKLAYFLAANKVKFRRTVVPGDQLRLEVEAGKLKSRTGQVFARAYVEEKLAAEAELMFALVED